jgi:hypothetical protein
MSTSALQLRSQAAAPNNAARSRLPARLILAYLCVTFLLFLVWPINWLIYDQGEWWRLSAYVAACFALLGLGFTLGLRGSPNTQKPVNVERLIIWGGCLSVLFLTPISFANTGRGPWEVLSAMADQALTYEETQIFIEQGSSTSIPVIAGSAIAPLFFAVLPLGIIYWNRISPTVKMFMAATVVCTLIISFMRGTDREFANLFIVSGSALMVRVARERSTTERANYLRRHWKGLVFMSLFVAISTVLFVSRKEGRLGGVDRVCAAGTSMCADLDSPLTTWMGDRANFGISGLVVSVSQGYYGLDLAMNREVETTWGIGHSPILLSIYEKYTGDVAFRTRAVTTKTSFYDDWSDKNLWSTLMAWLANDVGFIGAIFVLGLLGLLWGKTWRDAVYGHNDVAAVLFCAVMIMLAYLPANDQMFLSLEGFFTFYGLLALWLFWRNRRSATA